MTERNEPIKAEELELGSYRLTREPFDGGVCVKAYYQGEPVRPGALSLGLVEALFNEIMAIGADLDETRKALDHEAARASSLLDNWQATQSQAELAKAEQARDKLLAAELGRELARARDAAGKRAEMRAVKPLDPPTEFILSKELELDDGRVMTHHEDVTLVPQRSRSEAARVAADSHLPGGVPTVPPAEIKPAVKACPKCGGEDHGFMGSCPGHPF